MNYSEIYHFLYEKGYHGNLKNHGVQYVDYIVENYHFSSLLEIGCSQGVTVKKFQEKGIDSYGIDVSDVAIQEAKKMGLSVCQVGSVTNLPFESGVFDVVFSCDVLEHLIAPDVEKAIREIKRVSKKYLFLKIAYGKEKNMSWIEVLHRNPKYRNIKNLHQTVENKEWWLSKIVDEKWKFVESDFLNLMVFKQKEE